MFSGVHICHKHASCSFCKQITRETFSLRVKERQILFSVAVKFWDQNKTINTTRFVIWPQEQIYFQSFFFASWILVVSPELWNWNFYPNIYYSASEFFYFPMIKTIKGSIGGSLYFICLLSKYNETCKHPHYRMRGRSSFFCSARSKILVRVPRCKF